MSNITFKGTPVKTMGSLPKMGEIAPDFKLVRENLLNFVQNKIDL